MIPYRLAFNPNHDDMHNVTFYIIDAFFFIDILLNFVTTIPDKDNMVDISDKKTIAKIYLKSWFIIDFLSIVPFDDIFAVLYVNLGESNMLIRMTKIPKIYKIIRLLRLVKLIKVLKHKQTLT
jgi:potassium voltage-gated channel Eag-related subfamily H protein 7